MKRSVFCVHGEGMANNSAPSSTRQNRGTDGRIVVGIFAALTAAAMLAIMDAVAYNLRLTYGVIETQLIRNIAGVLFLVCLAMIRRESIFPAYKGRHIAIVRGIVLIPMGFLMFSSFRLLDQASATALVFTYPIILTILAAVLLGEKTGPWRWGAVVVGFIGVVAAQVALWMANGEEWAALSAQPIWLTALYSLMPVGAAVLFGFYMIAVRYLPQGLPALSITYVGALASLATIVPIWVIFGEREPLNWSAHWWQFGLLAVCSLGAAQSLNIAYRSAPAAVAGSLEYVGILFATGLAWMTQGLIPPVGIWFGVSLIILAGLITAWRESRHRQTETA